MDKKKLIGTIVGVIFFVALIAGATFAWLTFNAEVVNGTYNTKTGNFIINYTKGTNLNEVNIQTISSAADVLTSGAKSLTVKAGKDTGTAPNGKLTIKLSTETANTTLDLTSGVLKYAVSIGGATPSAINAVTSTSDITLVNAHSITSTTQTEFTVYFWLDAATVDADDMGDTYSGYIHASATQVE